MKNSRFFVIICTVFVVLAFTSCNMVKHLIERWYTLPEMVSISAGVFTMGNTLSSPGSFENEFPSHQVTLTYDYLMGKYETTNKQFLEFLNDASVTSAGYLNGKKIISIEADTCEFQFSNDQFGLKHDEKQNYPVIHVTWEGAVEYCNWLSEKEGLEKAFAADGTLINYPLNKGYRLPTEAEWEYAARGAENDFGTPTDYLCAGSNDIDTVAWFFENSTNAVFPIYLDKGTYPVGMKDSNEIGIYDMNGNVWEYCCDWNYEYTSAPQTNPVCNTVFWNRVVRGGAFYRDRIDCRLVRRSGVEPEKDYCGTGFRLAKSK